MPSVVLPMKSAAVEEQEAILAAKPAQPCPCSLQGKSASEHQSVSLETTENLKLSVFAFLFSVNSYFIFSYVCFK